MDAKKLNYFSHIESRPYSDQQQSITYSFNEAERTIIGFMEERGDQIYLFEYRGDFIGTEFFISFSKHSISYKFIRINKPLSEQKIL